jgi:hypothetical protein
LVGWWRGGRGGEWGGVGGGNKRGGKLQEEAWGAEKKQVRAWSMVRCDACSSSDNALVYASAPGSWKLEG